MNTAEKPAQLILPEQSPPPRETETAARALSPATQAAPPVDAFLAMIERAARDPAIDIDKMERMMQMREREMARRAREEFAIAFAELIPELPSIDRNGAVTVYSKSDREYAAKNFGELPAGARPIQQTAYATLDDILTAINPVLSQHGFSIRFEHETIPTGDSFRIKTKAILLHRAGHSESAETPPLQQDSSGSKNNVQGVGSSMKYGRRYALMAVLPIASHAPQDRDDDGKAAGGTTGPVTITPEQVETLRSEIIDTDSDIPTFLDFFKVAKLDDLPAKDFDHAMKMLDEKRRRAAKAKEKGARQ